MKFNKAVTVIKSQLEGQEQYCQAISEGKLQYVPILEPKTSHREPHWSVKPINEHKYFDVDAIRPLEVDSMVIVPRGLVIDELTRHKTTKQWFVPTNVPLLAVVGISKVDDADNPDPVQTVILTIRPGECLEVGRGTWHTLPFTFVDPAFCLSIIHQEEIGSYHDVRDLPALGWIGVPRWADPKAER